MANTTTAQANDAEIILINTKDSQFASFPTAQQSEITQAAGTSGLCLTLIANSQTAQSFAQHQGYAGKQWMAFSSFEQITQALQSQGLNYSVAACGLTQMSWQSLSSALQQSNHGGANQASMNQGTEQNTTQQSTGQNRQQGEPATH